MAHGFITFPASFDNGASRPDYWDLNRIPPGSGTNAVYGGESRYRKFFPGSRSGATNFETQNDVTEIEWLTQAGFDGFFPDVLQVNRPVGDTTRWTQFLRLLAACNIWNVGKPAGEKVWCAPMPDGTTSATSDPQILANSFFAIRNDPALWKFPNGDLLFAPYQPEGNGTNGGRPFWDSAAAAMHALGMNFRIWWCFQGPSAWTTYAVNFTTHPDTFGFGRWGTRDPVATSGTGNTARGATAFLAATYPTQNHWLAPVSFQDVRPNQRGFTEAGGWDQLIASWRSAIDTGAHSVQIPTWDDFAEMAAICPSEGTGFAVLDICAYYTVWFKLGVPPTIVRDGLYLAHRIHWCNPLISKRSDGLASPVLNTNVTTTGPQTSFSMRDGSTVPRNEIDLLAFLVTPGTIRISVTVNGGTPTVTSAAVGAGMQQLKAPQPLLAVGENATVKAELVRAGVVVQTITSPNTIRQSVVSEDFTYKYWGYGDQFNGSLYNRGTYHDV